MKPTDGYLVIDSGSKMEDGAWQRFGSKAKADKKAADLRKLLGYVVVVMSAEEFWEAGE